MKNSYYRMWLVVALMDATTNNVYIAIWLTEKKANMQVSAVLLIGKSINYISESNITE